MDLMNHHRAPHAVHRLHPAMTLRSAVTGSAKSAGDVTGSGHWMGAWVALESPYVALEVLIALCNTFKVPI